jgi:hypothetical protein
MMALLRAIVLSLFAAHSLADELNIGFTSYDNDFIEPNYILEKNWNATTVVAQESIVQWADWLAAQSPWCESIRFLTIQVLCEISCALASWFSRYQQAFSCTVK